MILIHIPNSLFKKSITFAYIELGIFPYSLIPMLNDIFSCSGQIGTGQIYLSVAHWA